jgi:hypothetical protein
MFHHVPNLKMKSVFMERRIFWFVHKEQENIIEENIDVVQRIFIMMEKMTERIIMIETNKETDDKENTEKKKDEKENYEKGKEKKEKDKKEKDKKGKR